MTKASGGRLVRQAKRGGDSGCKVDRPAEKENTGGLCADQQLLRHSQTQWGFRKHCQKIVQTNADIAEKLIRKKEENTADVLTYMESQRDMVCQIIGKGLAVLNDPAKLAEATPSQITTAIGTLIDKWTLLQEKTANDDSERVRVIIDV